MADEKDQAQEQPKTFLKFCANQKSPTLEIQVGEYHRSFKADDQPFEVKDKEEEQLLRNSGYFVSDKEAEAADEPSGSESESSPALKVQSPKSKEPGKTGGAPPPPDAEGKPSS